MNDGKKLELKVESFSNKHNNNYITIKDEKVIKEFGNPKKKEENDQYDKNDVNDINEFSAALVENFTIESGDDNSNKSKK